jgi:hypothetical protein
MFSGGVLEAFSSAQGGTDGEGAHDGVAGGDGAFAAGGPVRRAAGGTAGGKGSFDCAGNTSSPRTGTLSGTETIGVVPGSGPAISGGAALWGNGAATVFPN